MRSLFCALLMLAMPAAAAGIGMMPWQGDAEVGRAVDDELIRALAKIHPRVVEVKAGCDIDCARAADVDAIVTRAARGGFGEPRCIEVRLAPVSTGPRELALCRPDLAELRAAMADEVSRALRGPLPSWSGGISDIRDGELDEAVPEPERRAAKPEPPPRPGLVSAGAWTAVGGGALALAGVSTALGFLPVLLDPSAPRASKDIALNVGRTSLFVGFALGAATAATGGLVFGLGHRAAE